MHLNSRSAMALMVLLAPAYVLAQQAPAPAAEEKEHTLDTVVISTGTRTSGLKAINSPAPIEVIDGSVLQRTGQPDLVQALTQNLPSFTSDAKGGDASALTVAARLRGLSPNHTLILINGKRRHGTSNLNVSGGAFQGGAAADLGLIPAAAIDRIEVLQDGAAAQYGSDAIAGVINIILKKGSEGGSVTLNGGQYFDGGGKTGTLSANIGIKPAEGAFLNLSAETKYHGHSDRSDLDARFLSPSTANANVVNVPGYPYVNHTFGDARVRQDLLTANGGIELGRGLELYGLGTYARKDADAIQNYRGPSTAPTVYPLGFSPIEAHQEEDYALTLGLKGKTATNWAWDFSSTYGRDHAAVLNKDSINTAYLSAFGSSPTNFYEGFLRATQVTTNLDVNKDFDVGLASPLNVAFGLEQRRDTYTIGEGEFASWYQGGAAAFPGYRPTDAGSHSRLSRSVYVDVAVSPIERLQLDAAVRAERYSDFGDATVGKLTGRFEVQPTLAVRGTVSNGFRAPTLAEGNYSATSVSPTTASVILPSNSAAARVLGVAPLKAEKSQNLSLGLVATPSSKLTTTLDVYQINIKDRILQSGTLNGMLNGAVISPAVNAAIIAAGSTFPSGITSTGVSVYSNAADTRNRGADLVLTYAENYGGWGKVDWTVAANYNEVKVLRVKGAPAVLGNQKLLDQTARSYLEDASPSYRFNLGALWRQGNWAINVRENVFGPSSYFATIDNVNYYRTRIGTKFITDLDVNYRFNRAWDVSLGANNLFNVYPDEINGSYRAVLNANGRQNVARYPSFSPVGINGGYYYAKLNYKF